MTTTNICSIRKKRKTNLIKTVRDLDNIKNKCNKNKDMIKIVFIAETWISPDEDTTIYNKRLGMQTIETHRPEKTGGGVMIAVDKNVAIEKQLHFTDNHTSIVAIYCPQLNAAFATIYIYSS